MKTGTFTPKPGDIKCELTNKYNLMKLSAKQLRNLVNEVAQSSSDEVALAQLKSSGDIVSYELAGYYDNVKLVFPSGQTLVIRAEYKQYEDGGDVEPVLDIQLS